MKVRIGGQAVMEGVMMKNGDRYAVSVRKPDGEIETKTERYMSISDKYSVLKLPVLRGVVNFAESMVVGMKTITYSADFIEDGEEEPSRLEQWLNRHFSEKWETTPKRLRGGRQRARAPPLAWQGQPSANEQEAL